MMTDETDIELLAQAERNVMAEVKKLLEDKGPSLDKVLLRLRQELSAKEIKAQYDKDDGWQYSKALIAHNIRLRAVQVALNLHDAMPSEKHDVTVRGNPMQAMAQAKLVEKAKSKEKGE